MAFLDWARNLFQDAGLGEIGNTLLPTEQIHAGLPTVPYSQAFGNTHWDGSKWNFGLSATGQSPTLNHAYLRQNARSAYHDVPQAKALVDRYADTVVDCGLRLEPTPNSEILGLTPEKAEQWARKVETAFHSWASDKRVTRDESLTFYQMQRLMEVFQQRDNDYFVRLYYSDDPKLLNPLQLSFIDPNQISDHACTSTYGFQESEDGIVKDEQGREVGYKVIVKTRGEWKEKIVPAFDEKTNRKLMLHGFYPEYAGQKRGYSRIGHIIQEFENLTDFSSAQIKKAIIQSSITMFTEPSKDNPASNPFEDMAYRYSAGPLTTQESVVPTVDETGAIVGYQDMPEATFTRPGSIGIFNLMQGEKIKPFEHSAPSDSFQAFVDSFTSYLSASMSMPIEVLLMRFSQNYSASRAALMLFWRVAQIWRDELVSDMLTPIYEAWLSGEIAAGRVMAPGWSDPRLKAAWLGCVWNGAPMPNIDPQRTAEADKTYVELGATTLDRLSREHNGSNGAANRAKLQREFNELANPPWRVKGDFSNG